MNFTKQILKAGKYLIQTPSGERREEEITLDRIKSWKERFDQMLEAGLRVPAPYRHDLSVPLQKAQRSAKDNAGFWKKLWLDEKDNFLYGELEVPRQEDIDRVGSTVQEVSPYIKTWADGNGHNWEDSILHIALVTNPIIPGQENFSPAAAAANKSQPALALCLSQLLETELELAAKMSLTEIQGAANRAVRGETKDSPGRCENPWVSDIYDDHLIIQKGRKYFKQSYTIEDGTVKLSGVPVEVIREVSYNPKKSETELSMATNADIEKPQGEAKTTSAPSTATAASVKDVLAALRLIGLDLPDDTTPENLAERIVVASRAIKGKEDPEEVDSKEEPKEQPAPIAMSQIDPTSGVEVMSKELAFASKLSTADYIRRVDTLVSTGRITPAYASKTLKPMLEGLQLSLGEDGNPVRNPFDVILEGLELLPENQTLTGTKPVTSPSSKTDKKTGIRLAHEEAIPDEMLGTGGDMTEERVQEIIKEQLAVSGR